MGIARFHIPDLVALCGSTFELQANRHCNKVTEASHAWASNVGFLMQDELQCLPGLNLPLLASLCYPRCDFTQLCVVTKLLLVFFHWSTRFDSASIDIFEIIWKQITREMTPQWQTRFLANLEAFRQARIEANELAATFSMNIESYRTFSRSYSGILMMLDLTEYASGIRISNEIHNFPELYYLKQCAHDIISIAKNIASYNTKQSRGDGRTLVAVIMQERRCTLQSSMDAAGGILKDAVDRFLAAERKIPSWTPEVDEEVQQYVQGIRDCITGFIHWMYETDCYFGDKGEDVKQFGWVFLLPRGEEVQDTGPVM